MPGDVAWCDELDVDLTRLRARVRRRLRRPDPRADPQRRRDARGAVRDRRRPRADAGHPRARPAPADVAAAAAEDRAPSVIWVSSGGMYTQKLRADDLQYRDGEYSGTTAYARTKRMQVVLAEEWADGSHGTVVHSVHPGWVDTPGVADSLPTFKSVARPIRNYAQQGADTFVWMAAAAEPVHSSGRFWHDRRRVRCTTALHARVRDRSPRAVEFAVEASGACA